MRPTNLTIVQGTPFRLLVRVKERNEVGVLVPISLVGAVVRLQARLKETSPDLLLDLSSNGEGITLSAEAGVFVIQMTSAQTSALDWWDRQPVYQCEIVPAIGDTFRTLTGKILLDPEVVR